MFSLGLIVAVVFGFGAGLAALDALERWASEKVARRAAERQRRLDLIGAYTQRPVRLRNDVERQVYDYRREGVL